MDTSVWQSLTVLSIGMIVCDLCAARPRPRPLVGGGGGGSPDPPGRAPAPALAAADRPTAMGGAQSHEPARRFGLDRKFL
jgi:hypothetical protein